MQALTRSFYAQAALFGTTRRVLPRLSVAPAMRTFSSTGIELKQEGGALDVEQVNKRLGVDTEFNKQKHAYVLTFPWNFQEIINDYEGEASKVSAGSFWHRFITNNATYEINKAFREFHQACALPDYRLISDVCEGKLAQYVKESVRRIHFHGLDIELANLTVDQPKIKILKVEIANGISVDRSKNKPASEYNISKTSIMGAPTTVYAPKNDSRHFLDHLDYNYKPYVVSTTVLIESPMKLYV
jgi:hypothetical protein